VWQQIASGETLPLVGVCAGITKWTRTGVRSQWESYLRGMFPQARISVVPDYVTAFHGAVPSGVGAVVIAGTGSVIYGANANGESVRVGGRGWDFGDEGSGAWLTTEAVKRTLRALDGLEPVSSLTQTVCNVLSTQNPDLIGEAARHRIQQEGRGFLVPRILELAQTGNTDAANLFVGAAGWLYAYTKAALTPLGLHDTTEPVRVATVGGMWEAGELILAPFRATLAKRFPHVSVAPPAAPPVIGAVRLCIAQPSGLVRVLNNAGE
jgi:N-acetylglucosamine kinase-like BadF-type ATPase